MISAIRRTMMKINAQVILLSIIAFTIQTGAEASSLTLQVGTQFMAATVENVGGFYRSQPNCNGAVGPTQYIELTNQNIRSFNKETGEPDGVLNIDPANFFGTPIADAMLTYDRWGQRWIMTADYQDVYDFFGSSPLYVVTMAWSDGPIITKETKWSFHFFTTTELSAPGEFIDSPKLSTDADAVHLNGDIFNNITEEFLGVTAIVIPQSSFKEGNPFQFTAFPGLFTAAEYPVVGGLAFAPSPDNYDPDPEFGYIIVSPSYEVPGYFTYTNFLMLRILNQGTDHPTLYPSAANPISLAAPLYTDVGFVPHKGNLYGENGLLQNFTGLDFGMPHIRHKQLYFVISGLVDATGTGTLSGDRSAILWYQYDLTGDPSGQGKGIETESTVPALVQSGVIFDPTVTSTPINYWNGALMTDKDNNITIIGNSAGEDDYIQAFYTGRQAHDPQGTLRPLTQFTDNSASYNFGTLEPTDPNGERWGDYQSLKPDPCNDRDLWATSQLVAFQDGWGILATQFTTGGYKRNRIGQNIAMTNGAPYLLAQASSKPNDHVSVLMEGVALLKEKSRAAQCDCGIVPGGNLIAFNRGDGVAIINGSSANLVSSNNIRSNCMNGVEITSCGFDNGIFGNLIEKNGGHGVKYPKGSANQLEGNCIRGNKKSDVEKVKNSKNCESS
jgi:hypothetical protein